MASTRYRFHDIHQVADVSGGSDAGGGRPPRTRAS